VNAAGTSVVRNNTQLAPLVIRGLSPFCESKVSL
jgi:hypothetical protein